MHHSSTPSGMPATTTFLEVATTADAPAQMWANTEATTTAAAKPCLRDYAELVTKVVPEAIAQLVPLCELDRRLNEVVRAHPRFAEEAPIYRRAEAARRAAYQQLALR